MEGSLNGEPMKKKQARSPRPNKATPQLKRDHARQGTELLPIRMEHPWLRTGKILFLLSGWLVSLFLGLLELPSKIVSFTSNAPKATEAVSSWALNYKMFVGRFSSDPSSWKELNLIGTEEKQKDVGEIQLDIGYDGSGRFSGEIVSKSMESGPFPWSRIMIDGKVNALGAFSGNVWDIVSNQRAVYSSFKLEVEDSQKGTLRLLPARNGDGVFSGPIVLWPTDFEMADGASGKRFDEMLKKSWERYKEQGGGVRERPVPVDESK